MLARKPIRNLLTVLAIAIVVAPAAYAFWTEAAGKFDRDRAAALLAEIRGAQDVRFMGHKVLESPEGSVVVDLRADKPGRVHADVVSRTGKRGHSGFGRGSRGRFSDPELIAQNYRLDARGTEWIAGR